MTDITQQSQIETELESDKTHMLTRQAAQRQTILNTTQRPIIFHNGLRDVALPLPTATYTNAVCVSCSCGGSALHIHARDPCCLSRYRLDFDASRSACVFRGCVLWSRACVHLTRHCVDSGRCGLIRNVRIRCALSVCVQFRGHTKGLIQKSAFVCFAVMTNQNGSAHVVLHRFSGEK